MDGDAVVRRKSNHLRVQIMKDFSRTTFIYKVKIKWHRHTSANLSNNRLFWSYLQLVDGRNTLISSLAVTFFLQVGHLPCAVIAALMHFLQKIWPHFVDISSVKGAIHIGQLKTGSIGGSGDFLAFPICKRNINVSNLNSS